MVVSKCCTCFQSERGLIVQLHIMELAVSLRIGNGVLCPGSYGIMFGIGKGGCIDQA